MEKITDVLRRETTCSVHDEELQTCTETDKGLLWKEQRIAEQIAKVNNCHFKCININQRKDWSKCHNSIESAVTIMQPRCQNPISNTLKAGTEILSAINIC